MSEKEQPRAHHPRPTEVVIWYDEAPERRPPVTETGVIGWLRKNLFGSIADTAVTLVTAFLVIYVLWGLLKWSAVEADWNVVTRNLRLFMIGRYPVPEMNRVRAVLIILVLLSGFTWSLRGRAPLWIPITTAILLVLMFVVPTLANQVDLPSTYVFVNPESERGDFTNIALPLDAGTELTFDLSPADPLAGIPLGFSDVVSAAESGQAQQEIERYTWQLERSETDEEIEAPDPLPDVDVSVVIQVLDAGMTELLTLSADDQNTATNRLTILETGWIVLRIDPAGEYGAYWLEIDGYEVFLSGAEALNDLQLEYGVLPEIEDERTEVADSRFFKFRGDRTFVTFMSLQVGPFLEEARNLVLLTAVLVVAGYVLGWALSSFSWVNRVSNLLWILSLFVTVAFLRGFHHGEYMRLAKLILSLALAVPVLYGYLNASFLTLKDRGRQLLLGMLIVVIGAFWHYFGGINIEVDTNSGVVNTVVNAFGDLLGLLPTLSFWPSIIFAAIGLPVIWFALDANSKKVFLRWIGIGLAITAIWFIVALAALDAPLADTALEGSFLEDIPPFSLSFENNLSFISTNLWGGIVLTLALAIVSIAASFPIGVLLALGRRSTLPVIRIFSIGTIEIVRGVPLITILFMAQIMVPLLSPSLQDVDVVVRAMIGMTLFSAAYVAEIVRGGLQAVPSGQTEAAKAVGMSGWQTTVYIVLPQALRAVIPALVGQFISLFKDTSLVMIIGLLEILGVARTVINQAEFIGTQREALIFIGIMYFIGSYAMSYTSRRIEETGSGAARRL
jgi:His/Glu/Gln/Arg/opine family amino acid ABC transporter permease subunit